MSRILLVDDTKEIHDFVDYCLKPVAKRHIDHAFGGQDALTALGLQEQGSVPRPDPDVILLDIEMPDINGIELCKKIRKAHKYDKTPIIFVTGSQDSNSHAHALDAGASGFITKPIQPPLIVAAVNNALRAKKLSDSVDTLIEHRNSLTNMLVHDINNHLSVVQMNMDLGLNPAEPEKMARRLAIINNYMLELKTMTSSLLDIEKLESKSLPLKVEKFDAWALLTERADLIKKMCEIKGIHFKQIAPPEPAIIKADKQLVARTFTNLLHNAIKFTPAGKSITISADPGPAHWSFTVENEGPAIDKKFHKKIFEKFGQLECKEEMGHKGVGLGLAFCQLAMDAMHGLIRVQSPLRLTQEGEPVDVRFIITLPKVF